MRLILDLPAHYIARLIFLYEFFYVFLKIVLPSALRVDLGTERELFYERMKLNHYLEKPIFRRLRVSDKEFC